jgi:hypothetical protein
VKGHVKRGSGFRGVVNYLLTTEETKGRRTMRAEATVIGGNMSGRTPRELAAEFGESRSLRPGVRRPVWHCSLSLAAGEHLTDAAWQDVADGLLRKIGLDPDRHPYLLVRHMDTEYEHVHLVVSRISVGGELWHGKWEAHQVMQATGELEQEHGLALTTQFDPELHRERRALTTGQVQEALRLERVPTKLVLQQILDQALVDTPTTAAFLERLDAAGVDALPNIASTGRMSGFSFSFQETGEVFKASQLGTAYSWKRLQERLDYGQSRDVEVLRAQVVEAARRADLRATGVAGGEPGAHVGADRTLAQAMAKLTDEYKEASAEMRQQSMAQARDWSQLMDVELARQKTAMARIEALAEELTQATESAKTATSTAKRAAAQARAMMQADRFRTAWVAVGSGVACGMITFLALWIWLKWG